jgi:hypothetical protein
MSSFLKDILSIFQPNSDDISILPLNGYRNIQQQQDQGEEEQEDEEEEEEQEEEEEEEENKEKEKEFILKIHEKSKNGENFWFDIITTIEEDFDSGRNDQEICWMSKDHPYALMIRYTNYNKRNVKYPRYATICSIVGYKKEIIEICIETVKKLCKTYGFISADAIEKMDDLNNNNILIEK